MSETGRETMGGTANGTANGQEQLIIRPARLEDAPYLAALYAPYVEQTAITFEYEAPGAEEFARRICPGSWRGTPTQVRSTTGRPITGRWKPRSM